MEKKLLLQEEDNKQQVKEIAMLPRPQDLKMMLGTLSWQILTLLHTKAMYPLEIAHHLGIHEQKVYYHIHKLEQSGAIIVERETKKKGAIAKYDRTVYTRVRHRIHQRLPTHQRPSQLAASQHIQSFFEEFINADGVFEGKIVVGSPTPHGPFKTSARDGHYSAH
jgi:DNA-binding MarR family transcriptional regulator